jgi:hypothetical protein
MDPGYNQQSKTEEVVPSLPHFSHPFPALTNRFLLKLYLPDTPATKRDAADVPTIFLCK